MDDNQTACLGFSLCGGIGPITLRNLIHEFSSVQKAFFAPEHTLKTILKESQLKKLLFFRKTFNPRKEQEQLSKQDIWYVPYNSPEYPAQLLELYDPPICLFGRGDRSLFNFSHDFFVGIVGTRKPTSYGEDVSQWISSYLAARGAVIVSGMAVGIDTFAHTGSMKEKGKTIAVLGTPIDVVYPQQNIQLYNSIISSFGIAISEYPPGSVVHKGTFVARNRIIAGLCQKTIVVEGGVKSGALITAKCALELGRDVYAVPGQITSENSKGPHLLIDQGAQLLGHPNDVLSKDSQSKEKENPYTPDLSSEIDKKIFTVLSQEPLFIDQIVESLHITSSEILPALSLLEVRGIIEKRTDGKFSVVN